LRLPPDARRFLQTLQHRWACRFPALPVSQSKRVRDALPPDYRRSLGYGAVFLVGRNSC
jgi:hypothetical protein